MKNISWVLLTLISTFLFTSCYEREDENLHSSKQVVTFSSGVNKYETRVNEDGDQWLKDDEVGIYMISDNNDEFLASNVKYKALSSGVSTTFQTENAMYFPTDGSLVNFMAYHPYLESATTEYPINLSSQAKQVALDLMYATSESAANQTTGTAITLTFKHMLTKVVLNLTAKESVGDISNVKVTAKGMNTTATFDLVSKTIKDEGDAGDITAYASATANRYEFILLPLAELKDTHTIEFDVNGTIYSWTINKNDGDIAQFKSGYKYTFGVYLTDSGVDSRVETEQEGSVTPWNPEEGSGNAITDPSDTALTTPTLLSTGKTTTSVDLSWNAIDNAATYTYQYMLASAADDDESAITTVADITAIVATVSSLEANTAYKFRVKAVPAADSEYTESAYTEWVTVTTSSLAPTGAVTTAAELLAAIAAAADGDVIYLDAASNFYVNSETTVTRATVYTAATLTIEKSITLEGTSTSELARVNAKLIELKGTDMNFTIKNIEFSGFTVNSETGIPTADVMKDSYFLDIKDGSVNNLTIDNCLVHSVYNGTVRANRTATSLNGNVTITNNRIYNIGGNNGGLIACHADATTAGTWKIQNNTVTGIGQGFYATGNANKKVIILPKAASTLSATISNNTFFGITSSNNFIDSQDSNSASGTYLVEKNIVIFTAATKGPRLGLGTVTLSDNAVYPAAWSGIGKTYTETNTKVYTANPFNVTIEGFISLDADFTPNAELKALGWGDSRWLK